MTPEEALRSVSLVVVTLDEEDNLGRCLESAAGVGEIVVVDSFSRDRTLEIARAHGARVFQRPFLSAGDQKNWAASQAALEWVLVLDADETLSSALREEIARELAEPRADGYLLRRRSEFLGRTIRFCGWGKDRVLRLFRRGKGYYPERAVHERLVLDGTPARLAGSLDHRPYRDLADYVDRMKSYSRRGADELYAKGVRWFPGIVTHPAARFLRMYVLQLGFLDGAQGFILCSLAASGVFYKYAFLRELASRGAGGEAGGGSCGKR